MQVKRYISWALLLVLVLSGVLMAVPSASAADTLLLSGIYQLKSGFDYNSLFTLASPYLDSKGRLYIEGGFTLPNIDSYFNYISFETGTTSKYSYFYHYDEAGTFKNQAYWVNYSISTGKYSIKSAGTTVLDFGSGTYVPATIYNWFQENSVTSLPSYSCSLYDSTGTQLLFTATSPVLGVAPMMQINSDNITFLYYDGTKDVYYLNDVTKQVLDIKVKDATYVYGSPGQTVSTFYSDSGICRDFSLYTKDASLSTLSIYTNAGTLIDTYAIYTPCTVTVTETGLTFTYSDGSVDDESYVFTGTGEFLGVSLESGFTDPQYPIGSSFTVSADDNIYVNAVLSAEEPIKNSFSWTVGEHRTYYVGDTAPSLSVDYSSPDGGTLSYQWWYENMVDGFPDYDSYTEIPGATSSTYTPPTNAPSDRIYSCTVTNTLNGTTATSTPTYVRITVQTPAGAPTVTPGFTVGQDMEYNLGSSASLSVSASSPDGGTLSYQWYYRDYENGSPTGSWTAIPGAYSPTVSIDTSEEGEKMYRCTVTNTLNGSAKSVSVETGVVSVISMSGVMGDLNDSMQDMNDKLDDTNDKLDDVISGGEAGEVLGGAGDQLDQDNQELGDAVGDLNDAHDQLPTMPDEFDDLISDVLGDIDQSELAALMPWTDPDYEDFWNIMILPSISVLAISLLLYFVFGKAQKVS